jgi:hypothetical protein
MSGVVWSITCATALGFLRCISFLDMPRIIARRRVPVYYGVEDMEQALAMAECRFTGLLHNDAD